MRPARLTVVLVAHGSRDPRAAASTAALARAVRAHRPDWRVRAAFLDHAGPRPLDVLSALRPGSRAVVVPLLLTSAYHGRVDIPAVVAEASVLPISVTTAEVLGPVVAEAGAVSPLLLDGLVRRLCPDFSGHGAEFLAQAAAESPASAAAGAFVPAAAGALVPAAAGALVPTAAGAWLDGVVLAAAGTRSAEARATVEAAADALRDRLGVSCAVAYASAAPPEAGEAVRRLNRSGARRVGMAAYFLAPGLLYDNAVRSARAAGAVSIAEPLGDAPELARLVADRVLAAESRTLAAAA